MLLSALLVAVLAIRVEPLAPGHPAFSQGDHLVYIAMAAAPSAPHPAPYCYRVLVPALARGLPFAPKWSFRALAIAFLWGTGVLMYYLLRGLGQERLLALLGVALFHSLNFGTKFLLYDFWLTEPALFFFSTLAMLFLVRGGAGAASGMIVSSALCLSVLSKESALFVLPLAYTMTARRLLDRRAFVFAAVVGLAPTAIYLLERKVVPASNVYSPLALFSQFGAGRLTTELGGIIRGGTLGAWGVLTLVLMLLGLRRSAGFALRSLPFIALVYLQPLFAENVDRLLVFGFLVVIPIAVAGLATLASAARLAPWMTALTALVPFVLVAAKSDYQSPSPEQQILVLALWTILIVIVKRSQVRREA